MSSNTTAGPRCLSSASVAALTLMIAPSGASVPRSPTIAPVARNGRLRVAITSPSGSGASRKPSNNVPPLTVGASTSSGASSRSSAGTPPA